MNLIYRKAIAEDVKACIVLRGKTRENALTVKQLNEIGVTHESWKNGIIDDTIPGYVCLSNKEIVGYCFGQKDSGEVIVLVVHPDYENKGIGKKLLNKVISNFKELGFKKLFLSCSPYPESRSYGFYRHLGWVSTGKFDIHQDEILEYIY